LIEAIVGEFVSPSHSIGFESQYATASSILPACLLACCSFPDPERSGQQGLKIWSVAMKLLSDRATAWMIRRLVPLSAVTALVISGRAVSPKEL
jgi:hypothetical protein